MKKPDFTGDHIYFLQCPSIGPSRFLLSWFSLPTVVNLLVYLQLKLVVKVLQKVIHECLCLRSVMIHFVSTYFSTTLHVYTFLQCLEIATLVINNSIRRPAIS